MSPRPSEEFFNLSGNPEQKTNLIRDPKYSKDVSELKTILAQWQAETGDTRPANLTPDWYGREKGETLPSKGKRGEMPGASSHADKINAKGPF
jgi:N-sulfoglucosamine sulfohydrolase